LVFPFSFPKKFLGNTAQFAFGIFRKNHALISSVFLAIHKVFLRKTAIIRTQILSQSALVDFIIICLAKPCVQAMGGKDTASAAGPIA
jgi:hypothetical protein